MRIDHTTNPFGIVKRFKIPYDGGRRAVEGQIRAITEEGYTDANWFEGCVVYPSRGDLEVGGWNGNYVDLIRGSSKLEDVEKCLAGWCRGMDLEVSEVTDETLGVAA